MARKQKVLRSRGRIYAPMKGKIIKLSLFLGGALLLFLLGWLIYDPIIEALNANKTEEPTTLAPETEVEINPTPQKTPNTFMEKGIRGIYVPVDVLSDDELFASFLEEAKGAGINALLFDMKTEEGNLTYASSQESVKEVGVSIETPLDLAGRTEEIKNAGLLPMARIFAFMDTVTSANNPDMAIRYMDAEGVVWLDDASEQGGRSWLSPYSEKAQKYILDIMYDAELLGIESVLIDGFSFPGEYGIRFAWFGENAGDTPRGEVLSRFAQKLYSAADKRGISLVLSYDATMVHSKDTKIYGASPATFSCHGSSPIFSLSESAVNALSKELLAPELLEDKGEIIKAMVNALSLSTKDKLLPFIDASGLSAHDLFAVTEGLKAIECESFILYDGSGEINLSNYGALCRGEEIFEEPIYTEEPTPTEREEPTPPATEDTPVYTAPPSQTPYEQEYTDENYYSEHYKFEEEDPYYDDGTTVYKFAG